MGVSLLPEVAESVLPELLPTGMLTWISLTSGLGTSRSMRTAACLLLGKLCYQVTCKRGSMCTSTANEAWLFAE